MRILLTGAAGFIGARTAEFLLDAGHEVHGVDELNDYYDVRLKHWRLDRLIARPHFCFSQADIADPEALSPLFQTDQFGAVLNLAARAGVRYSLVNPELYFRANVLGNLNLLELCRRHGVRKYILASTSSLYAGMSMPFVESAPAVAPISPYAASKGAAELTCYTYHALYGLDVTILRYFTVYGPAGRPDMSVYRFIRWIDQGLPIVLYGDGSQERDFTYIDDIARGTVAALKPAGYEIINLGNNHPHRLRETIELIEGYLGKKARIDPRPFQATDLEATWASIDKARRLLDWRPEVTLADGIRRAVEWNNQNQDLVNQIAIDLSK